VTTDTDEACRRVRLELGVLAVGALPPGEERSVREHLAACPACRSEADALTRTARLLGLVEPADLDRPAPAPGDRLLRRLLDTVAEERRRERRRRLLVAVAAGAAGIAVALGGVLAATRADAPPTAGEPAPTADATPAPDTTTLAATSAGTGAAMRLAVTARDWGTELELDLRGVPPGASCSLVAVGVDGSTEVAATWKVPAGGYGDAGRLRIDGAVGYTSDEVDRYEVVLADGRVLVAADA
jgi:hypothetical protein